MQQTQPTDEMLKHFTLLDPGFVSGIIGDPWPVYHTLLERAPILMGIDNFFYISPYTLVKGVLSEMEDTGKRRPRFVKRGFNEWYKDQLGEASPIYQVIRHWLFLLDPPDQLRLRRLVQKAFSHESINQLLLTIQHITDDLLDMLIAQGRMDAIRDFALQVPLRVICAFLRIPAEDRQAIERWTDTLVPVFDPAFLHQVKEGAEQAMGEFISYTASLLATRRQHPGDDLLSGLIHAADEGKLSDEELVSMVPLLIMAGYETTKDMLGASILALIQHEDQRSFLLNDPGPEGLANVVEELLRFLTPTQIFQAQAAEDVELPSYEQGGTTKTVVIHQGMLVNGLLAGANRDRRVFANPDQLDFTRPYQVTKTNLSLSTGLHSCLGGHLAKAEAQIALPTFFRRLPSTVRLVDEDPNHLVWKPSIFLRGLVALPVTW